LDNVIARDDWQHSVIDTSIGDARAALKRRAVGGLEQRHVHVIVAADRERSAADPPVGRTCAFANRFVARDARLDNPIAGDDWQYFSLYTSVRNAGAAVNRRAVGSFERHAIMASDRENSGPSVGGTRAVANRLLAANGWLHNAIPEDDRPNSGVDTSVGDARVAVNRRAGGNLERRHAIVASDRKNSGPPVGGARAFANRFVAANAWIYDAIAGDDWAFFGIDISVDNACAAIKRSTVKADCKRCFDVVAITIVAKP
jgi:hypothetical protein